MNNPQTTNEAPGEGALPRIRDSTGSPPATNG